jgi:hypothetical protein
MTAVEGAAPGRPCDGRPVRPLFYDDQDLEAQLQAGGRTIFLAGPTARGVARTPWRARAMERLDGVDGLVVIPEPRDGTLDGIMARLFDHGQSPVPGMKAQSYNVLRWETCGIERSALVLFWMPFVIAAADDPASLPGFTTRAEVSREIERAPQRVVLGMPAGALAGSHIRYHAHAAGVRVWETLEETVAAAVAGAPLRAS